MLKQLFIQGVAVTLLSTQTSATMSWGHCIKTKLQDRLSLSKYEGLWFEQARDRNFRFEHGDC